MSSRKKLGIGLGGLLLALLVAGAVWCSCRYVKVGKHLYPRNAQLLDLRGEAVSISEYETLAEALPGCEILWNVPFRNTAYPVDVTQITVTALAEEDLEALAYLPELEVVLADQCRDYGALARLRERYPQLQVVYSIVFHDGTAAKLDAREICLASVTEADVRLLEYLPELKRVTVRSGGDLEAVDAFRGMAHNLGLEFGVRIGTQVVLDTEQSPVLTGLKEEELPLLELLPSLETLHIRSPEASARSLLALRRNHPEVEITWEVEVAGQTLRDTVTEVDLSGTAVKDLEEVERKLAYLPRLRKLTLGLCGLDDPAWAGGQQEGLAVCEVENDAVMAYRDRVRDQYTVVWWVRLGPDIVLRTDARSFSPGQFGVEQLRNAHAYNLRCCENMVSLDLGHTGVSDVGFLTYMPELKHLSLAYTQVQYIDAIQYCPKLVLLELDNSFVRDYTPLMACTALEDLNLGKTYSDFGPVAGMTWLKNLYLLFEGREAYELPRLLPDTNVTAGAGKAASWQKLPNYQEMRRNIGSSGG